MIPAPGQPSPGVWTSRARHIVRQAAPGLLGILLTVSIWAIIALKLDTSTVLPGPMRVMQTLGEERALLLDGAWRSSLRVGLGWLGAVLIAVPLGYGMGLSPVLDRELSRLLTVFRPVPPFAWLPLVLLWVGVGERSAVLICLIGALPPVLSHARASISGTPRPLLDAARNLGANGWTLLTRVRVPAALPLTISGLQRGWTLAWMSLVAVELVGTDGGLGQIMLDARNLARPDLALAAMVVLGVIAAGSGAVLGWLQSRLPT